MKRASKLSHFAVNRGSGLRAAAEVDDKGNQERCG